MAIKLAHNCSNCSQLSNGICEKHHVAVSGQYTCDSFEMKASLKDYRSCTSCSKYEDASCAHPSKAAPGMLCASWSPQGQA